MVHVSRSGPPSPRGQTQLVITSDHHPHRNPKSQQTSEAIPGGDSCLNRLFDRGVWTQPAEAHMARATRASGERKPKAILVRSRSFVFTLSTRAFESPCVKACMPAFVPSTTRSRSSAAMAAIIVNIRLPAGVPVSIASAMVWKWMPRRCRSSVIDSRCWADRPKRSSFHTTRVSPSHSWRMHKTKSGRSSRRINALLA